MMKNPRNLFIFAVLGGFVGMIVGAMLVTFLALRQDAPVLHQTAEADIRSVMSAQVANWNEGDIEGFMEGYLRGEDLRFASGGKVNSGWQPTLDGYLTRYPDRATMGELAFTDLDVEVLDADDALVFGRWALQRDADRPNGLFTLHFRKVDDNWVIVSDHTSSAN